MVWRPRSRVRRRSGRARAIAPALALVLALAACAGTPISPQDVDGTLTEAAAFLGAGNPDAALQLLERLDPKEIPSAHRDRQNLLLGRALYETGDPWEAYKTIRDFADNHPHSELRPQIVELEYRAGRALSRSDGGFLIFSSDRRAAREVLEHLITRYPNNAFLADALRTLGEMAFEDGDYTLAQARFLDLMKQRPESEWFPLARFRYAMSLFKTLQGPEYDLDQMQRARVELTDFLANPPENPEFVREATAARSVVTDWLAQRHLIVADFYQTVGNQQGKMHHLEKAATDFAETEPGKRAQAMLAELGAEEARK